MMPLKYKSTFYTVYVSFVYLAVLLLSSCSRGYHIGVSQCVGGPWRDKVNDEMISAQHLFDKDVRVDIVDANNDTKRQVRQIDSMIQAGVDLLVISPNEDVLLKISLERARQKGIPVILYDRKAEGHYTAFIGGDNIDAGKSMGIYAVSLVYANMERQSKPKILELNGPLISTPDIERHKGFKSVMSRHPQVDYRVFATDWTRRSTNAVLTKLLKSGYLPDVVFCHSDWAAFGATDALKALHLEKRVKVLGIDGLPGKDEGIEAVRTGLLAGTYIYPTHGTDVIELALKILEHKPYQKVNNIKGTVVNNENASGLSHSAEQLALQGNQLNAIQKKLESYLSLYHVVSAALVIAVGLVILAVIALILIVHAARKERKAKQQMMELNREQMKFRENSGLINDLYHVIETKMSDPNLRVDDIAADVGMSRTQLYRKLKTVMDVAPNDLLKDARLNKARQLLHTTTASVSEIAFAVGFSSQSYFTSCYKQKYGINPSEDRI